MLDSILPPLSIQFDTPAQRRTTIADYLIELGAPQSEAEGQLIESLKQLDRWQQQAGEGEQIRLNLLAIDLFETALRYRKQASAPAASSIDLASIRPNRCDCGDRRCASEELPAWPSHETDARMEPDPDLIVDEWLPPRTPAEIGVYLNALGTPRSAVEQQVHTALRRVLRFYLTEEGISCELIRIAEDICAIGLAARAEAGPAHQPAPLPPWSITQEGLNWVARTEDFVGYADDEDGARESLIEYQQILTGERCPHCYEPLTGHFTTAYDPALQAWRIFRNGADTGDWCFREADAHERVLVRNQAVQLRAQAR